MKDKDGTTTAEISDGKDGKDGRDGVDGKDGKDGRDGESITIETSKSGDITTLVFKNSFTGEVISTAAIEDGAEGKQGPAGQNGADGAAGKDGTDGKNGTDGDSVTVSASKAGKVTTVEFRNARTGSVIDTASIADGSDGKDGADGADYVLTAADKAEIANTVYGMLDNANGESF